MSLSPLLGANRFHVESITLETERADQVIVVMADNDAALSGFQVAIRFEPEVLQVTGIEVADPADLGGWQPPLTDIDKFVKNDVGELFYGVNYLLEGDGADPERMLAPGTDRPILRLTVRVLAGSPTSTFIDFSDDLTFRDFIRNAMVLGDGTTSTVFPDLGLEDEIIDVVECLSPAPLPPTNLGAASTVVDVTLSWTESASGETEYALERQGPGEAGFSLIQTVPVGTARYTDTDVLPDTTYLYRLRAINSNQVKEPCRASDYVGPLEVKTDAAPVPPQVFARRVQVTDRIAQTTQEMGQENWYAFGALEDTRLDIKLRSLIEGRQPSNFDLALFHASGDEIALSPLIRTKSAQVKKLLLPLTDTYYLRVVLTDQSGSFQLQLNGKPPRTLLRVKEIRSIANSGDPAAVTFSGLPGALLKVVVKGKKVDADVLDLLNPAGAGILAANAGTFFPGPKSEKIVGLILDDVGVYTLRTTADFADLPEAILSIKITVKAPKKRSIADPGVLPLVPVPFADS